MQHLPYDALVLATGAYDRTVALPGWTLPGVLTAGAAHTLAKAYGVIPGRRVVVAGAGPFLLPVADVLAAHGARVTVIEATRFRSSLRGLPTIARDPAILRQTVGYTARLTARRATRHYGRLVTAILGTDRVEAVTTAAVDAEWRPIAGSERTRPADAVCLGFGFVPQLELAQLVGCRVVYREDSSDFSVWTDPAMRTSERGVYAAGELTGVAGVRAAVLEGALAGLTAASDLGLVPESVRDRRARELNGRLRGARRLAEWIRVTYRPRPGLWSLAPSETVACRCEDVTIGQVESALVSNAVTPYAVKTATRLGMGLCQGRICSPFLIEWLRANRGYRVPQDGRPWVVRPPVRPVPIGDWSTQPPATPAQGPEPETAAAGTPR